MIITFTRSSGMNTYESYCEHSHFLTYVLGYQQDPNKKTLIGSAVHLVLEILACCKKELQDNPNASEIVVQNDTIDEIRTTKEEMYKITELTEKEIATINKTRKNKEKYRHDCYLAIGTTRMGVDFVQDLIKRSTYYYAEKSIKDWDRLDFIDAQNYTWMTLELDGGIYDPRNQDIVEPEKSFTYTFPDEWAKYEYEVDGKIITGQYGIKGTIDLVTRNSEGHLVFSDYKTGQRKDWGTDQIKDYAYLQTDKQLMFYYFAARRLFPEVQDLEFNIIFVRDGGCFTLYFDDSHYKLMEDFIRKHFESVRDNEMPARLDSTHKDFRCFRLCHFFKNNMPGTNTNMCDFIHKEIEEKGILMATELHKVDGFDFKTYSAPGT